MKKAKEAAEELEKKNKALALLAAQMEKERLQKEEERKKKEEEERQAEQARIAEEARLAEEARKKA
jgi:hypothetical protein